MQQAGTAGGGALQLTVNGTLTVNGIISANGLSSSRALRGLRFGREHLVDSGNAPRRRFIAANGGSGADWIAARWRIGGRRADCDLLYERGGI